MNFNEREKTLELFKVFTTKVYGKDIALWLSNNWSLVEAWHFELIEHLRGRPVENTFTIL